VTLLEITKQGFDAQAQQDARAVDCPRLAAETREALRLASLIAALTPQDMLGKARLLASVVYREGLADYRFDLALSLLRDMGETAFAERRYNIERHREPGSFYEH
jgi:hypothetical protein